MPAQSRKLVDLLVYAEFYLYWQAPTLGRRAAGMYACVFP